MFFFFSPRIASDPEKIPQVVSFLSEYGGVVRWMELRERNDERKLEKQNKKERKCGQQSHAGHSDARPLNIENNSLQLFCQRDKVDEVSCPAGRKGRGG